MVVIRGYSLASQIQPGSLLLSIDVRFTYHLGYNETMLNISQDWPPAPPHQSSGGIYYFRCDLSRNSVVPPAIMPALPCVLAD